MQPDWEIWLDVNLSPILAKWMGEHTGIRTRSAYIMGYQTKSDIEIYKFAKEQGNVIIISKDSDFADIINRLGAPPKLINLLIGNKSNKIMWEILKPSIKGMIDYLMVDRIQIIDFEN